MEEIESVGVTGAGDEMIEVEIEEEIGNVNFLCICPANLSGYIMCDMSHLTPLFIY